MFKDRAFQSIFRSAQNIIGLELSQIVLGMYSSVTLTKCGVKQIEPADCNVLAELHKVRSCETVKVCSSYILFGLRRGAQNETTHFVEWGTKKQSLIKA